MSDTISQIGRQYAKHHDDIHRYFLRVEDRRDLLHIACDAWTCAYCMWCLEFYILHLNLVDLHVASHIRIQYVEYHDNIRQFRDAISGTISKIQLQNIKCHNDMQQWVPPVVIPPTNTLTHAYWNTLTETHSHNYMGRKISRKHTRTRKHTHIQTHTQTLTHTFHLLLGKRVLYSLGPYILGKRTLHP